MGNAWEMFLMNKFCPNEWGNVICNHYLCKRHIPKIHRLMNSRELSDRYVNPYTDFGFKKLFGTEINKDLLISFINSLLHGKEVVKDLTYLNTEHLGTGEADRKAVFDVYCENEKGEKILVDQYGAFRHRRGRPQGGVRCVLRKRKRREDTGRNAARRTTVLQGPKLVLRHLPHSRTGTERGMELQAESRICHRHPQLHLRRAER